MFDESLQKYDYHVHAKKTSEIKEGNFHSVIMKLTNHRSKTVASKRESEQFYKNFT